MRNQTIAEAQKNANITKGVIALVVVVILIIFLI
jgi:hypothetical protein